MWTVLQSDQINVLIGARKLHHIEENLQATHIDLEKDDIKRMTQDANRVIAQSI